MKLDCYRIQREREEKRDSPNIIRFYHIRPLPFPFLSFRLLFMGFKESGEREREKRESKINNSLPSPSFPSLPFPSTPFPSTPFPPLPFPFLYHEITHILKPFSGFAANIAKFNAMQTKPAPDVEVGMLETKSKGMGMGRGKGY